MDRLAAALGMDPVELRAAATRWPRGTRHRTGQVIDSRRARSRSCCAGVAGDAAAAGTAGRGRSADLRSLPGGVSNTTHGEGVVRGVGYAVAYKNVGFSEGFDDYSTARVRLEVVGRRAAGDGPHRRGRGRARAWSPSSSRSAAPSSASSGSSCTARTPPVGSAGSTSASRQTYVTGGAVKAACEKVRAAVLALAEAQLGPPGRRAAARGRRRRRRGEVPRSPVADVLGDDAIEETVEWRHRPTVPVDPETGQGDAHVQYAFSAHRAVVDVDVELGLVKVVALDCAQDVGKAINPQAVVGQIQGGSAQGLGLALMEEIVVDGRRDPQPVVHRLPDPHHPRHARRCRSRSSSTPTRTRPTACAASARPPTISSGPAVAARSAQAVGRPLPRVPIRPEHITGT